MCIRDRLMAGLAGFLLQILATIAATIFTAVDTAPSIIRTEMSGVRKRLPTPL